MGKSLLDEKSEDELWLEYRDTKDPKIRDTFLRQYAPLVKYVAAKAHDGMPAAVEFDDLVSYGTFGLLDAIERFDLGQKVKFKTYAVSRIRGAIFDELRSSDWVPRSVRQKMRDVEDAITTLETRHGRPASDSEVAAHLNMSEADYYKTLGKIQCTSVLSLDEPKLYSDENDIQTLGDSIEGPSSLNPDVEVERNEMRRIIFDVISNLPEKERKIIILYHYEDATLREIGQVLGITESRVSQLHTKALLRIRAKLTNVRKGIM